ncbi:rho guanine nucleotide exchange factor 39 [Bombina bombina]|uniref:rho guanine nucleotide exchange factor 39 n=1 Tax=Bombina bombina TaxID=8345 RepID=UPI00235A5A2B|nr:rho guanine nucleotide exchange factor 39 [Bombina bombina]
MERGRWRHDNAQRETCTLEDQRERWDRKRARTAKELLETERRYVEELELITKFYDEVFRARCSHLKIARIGICGTIPEILISNRTLLTSLETGCFGTGFEMFSDSLELYKKHAVCLDATLQSIKAIFLDTSLGDQRYGRRGHSAFPTWRRPVKVDSELRGIRGVTSFRYKHYVQDLAENSLPGSSDTPGLSRALDSLRQVCQYIRGLSKCQENDRQLKRVQKMLKGRQLQIVNPGRRFIREGWLFLVPPSGEDVKHRMMFLFSDLLLVTSPCHPLHPLNARKFSCRALYPLRECRVERVLGHTQSQGGLVSLMFEKEKLLLMSTDQQDINEWYTCLDTAVRLLRSGCKISTQSETPHREPEIVEETPCIYTQSRKRHLVDKVTNIEPPESSIEGNEPIAPKKVKMMDTRPVVGPKTPVHDQKTEWRCIIL